MTEILYASRSWSNECKGKDMFSCIAIDGVVVCYFPTQRASDQYAGTLQRTLQGHATSKVNPWRKDTWDPNQQMRLLRCYPALAARLQAEVGL